MPLSAKKILFFILLLMLFLSFGQGVLAEDPKPPSPAIQGLNQTAGEGYLGKSDAKPEELKDAGIITQEGIPEFIGKVVGAGLAFIGVIFFVLMIYAGFTWMLARGNEQEAKKAKDLIVDAVIGLVIVLAAYAITSYIGSSLTTN